MIYGFGIGSNYFAELMSLKLTLLFALEKGYKKLQVFGDSKLVIDWFNRTTLYHTGTPYTISRGGRHICLGINLMTSYVQIFTGRETPFLISYPRKGHSRFRAHG